MVWRKWRGMSRQVIVEGRRSSDWLNELRLVDRGLIKCNLISEGGR